MKWLAILFSTLLLGTFQAASDPLACEQSETACVLDAAWSAALILPEEKRAGLATAFLEIASMSGEPAIISKWEGRFERRAEHLASYPDYGWHIAEPILDRQGVDALISMAKRRADPLNFGRADVLLAAGKRFQITDTALARQINQAMMQMLGGASSFEKPLLANAAAELAMIRCDAPLMREALRSTDAPENLRYAFWRSRIDGNAKMLLSDIRAIRNDEDTREIRRVLDGYRAILEHGYCADGKSEIGG